VGQKERQLDVLVVFMIAGEACSDIKVPEQIPGDARVFGRDERDLAQCPERPGRYVFQIAYRCTDQIEGAHAGKYIRLAKKKRIQPDSLFTDEIERVLMILHKVDQHQVLIAAGSGGEFVDLGNGCATGGEELDAVG